MILLFAFSVNVNIPIHANPTNKILGSDYEKGWNDGYADGWCYGKGYGCYAPTPPYPPYPRYGEDHYKGGFERGFLKSVFFGLCTF